MIHKGLKYFIALLLLVHCLGGVFAQNPGRVDTLFNPMMGVGFTGNSRISYVSDGIELPDGSVVVVGNFTAAEGKSVGRIAKFDSDGKLDPSFNSGNAGANGVIYTIKRQTDGKFIIGGDFTSYNGTARNRLVRINADGSLDNTFNIGTGFNGGGVYSIYLPCDSVGCDSVLTVGGYFTNYNGTSVSHIVRLTTNGTRDASFSTTASGLTYIQSIACQSTGKYIIMGYTPSTGSGVRRLNADGTLDDTFNPGGLGARYPGTNHYDYSAIVLPDDKIILGGNFILYDDSTSTDSTANRLVRLHSNGIRDNSFNIGTGFNNIVRSIYRYPNGKIVVTGNFSSYNGISVNRVVCIDTTGSVDSTFSIGTGLNDVGWRVFPGASKLYFAGQFNTCNSIARWGFVRVNTNGSIDNSFLSQSGLNGRVLDVAIQADGKVILVGQFNRYNNNNVGYLVRLNVNGTIDGSFNASGAGANGIVRTVEVLPSGKILIGGDFGAYNGTTRGRIALLNTDGTLDNSVFASGANNFITDIAVSPNGKIYVGGNFGAIGGGTRSRVACYNPDFTLNNSGVGSGALNGTVYHIAFQNDNRVLLSGGFGTYKSVAQGQLICIDTLGNIDSTFYKGTGLTTSFSGTNMRFQKDGKILLSSGNINYNGVPKGCYARLNTDGTLDNTYTSTHTGNYYGGYDIYELGSGILVGGDHLTLNGQSNMGFGYVNKDGSANTEFYGNGGICGLYNLVAVRTIPDNIRGRILIVGEFSTIQNKLSPYFASLDNYINELDISPTLCAGAATKLYFNKGVTFNSDNIFTVQLSDESGSFASPVEIGRDTTDGWGPDSVQVSVPTGTSYGTGYRVRVVSTSPVFTSLSTGPITINASPTQKTVLQSQAAVYPSLGTEVKVVATQTGVHYSLMNDTTVVDTGSGNGDTLRLYTNSIYNTTNYTVIAQAGGCSRILDTVTVDTLALMPVSWQLEGIAENPDHSLHIIPGNGKPEAKGYNLMKSVQNGAVLYRFQSGDNYEGMFGLVNPEGPGEYLFINVLTIDTGKWDSTGLYFSINKDDLIYLRPAITSNVDVLVKKTGTTLGVYINGLLDTTIVWPDTVSFSPMLNSFGETGSMKGVYSSYGAILHGTVSAQNINCGDKGNASASMSGGSPPYHFHWSNGDTTSTPDSLLVGRYIVTVTDFVNDTLIDSVEIAYTGMLDTICNVEPDSLGRLISINNTAPYSSYAWYVNILPDGEDGWLDYAIPEGTTFQGYMGLGNSRNLDETTRGIGVLILGNDIYCTGTDFDMTYLGWYEPGRASKFRIRFDGDNVYFSKVDEYSGGGMEISLPFLRGAGFRAEVFPMTNGSIIPNVTSSFGCETMFTYVKVQPATAINTQGQVRVDVKGGKAPYTYSWSNAATTATINTLPGNYTVTITDQNSATVTAQAFVGAYVQWLASLNVEENSQHEIIGTETPSPEYGLQYNYKFGANALKQSDNGTVSFDLEKAGDFCGTLGISTDFQMHSGSRGFAVIVVQERLNVGLDENVYYVGNDGDIQYFGSFNPEIPMNIKIKKIGTTIEFVKNDIGGVSMEYTYPYTLHPAVAPIFEGDKVKRVTVDYGVPVQAFETVQHVNCNDNTLGGVSLNVIGGQPPYHYQWANGDTTSNPDSLYIGLHTVMVWDSQQDTIIDSIYVGYGIVWDTTFNVDDTLGKLVSQGNNSTETFDSYAYGLNSLAPGEDGWIEFVLPQDKMFNGALSLSSNKYYDETSEGLAVNIVGDLIVVSGSMLEHSEQFDDYKVASGYKVRIEFIGNSITISLRDILGIGVGRWKVMTYERTKDWSPSIIFGLNGATVAGISASFGCGSIHADAIITPAAKNGISGSIHTNVKGGVAPYTYTWSNGAITANLINVPIGKYTVTVEDQTGDEEVVSAFVGRYVDWDVLSGMSEEGTSVSYYGDTVNFDSTIVNFAFARNTIKPNETGTVSFDFEHTKDYMGVFGLVESPDFHSSNEGAFIIMATIGQLDDDKELYYFDENGDPAYFGKLRENLAVNMQMKKTPTEIIITKNEISSVILNRAIDVNLSPTIVPGIPGSKVKRITCDFGKKLQIMPIVTPVECGTSTTGSITAVVTGGIPPYYYQWNTGDTTDVNDSLTIGGYSVLVTDSIGDSVVAYITMGYGANWGSLVGVTAATDNSISPSIPFDENTSYALASSTLYPIVGETGWMEFSIEAGIPFEGYLGLVNDMTFDENMFGLGIVINEGHIFSTSTDPNNRNMYLGRYNQAIDNNIRITKIAENEIEISVNGYILLSSDYDYPSTIKPVVLFNNADSRVKRLVSSFCNTYQDEFTIAYEVVHTNDKRKGGLYIEPVGGTPPFQYLWSDLGSSTTYLNTLYTSDALNELGIDSAKIDSLINAYPSGHSKNRSNLEIGDYTVTVTDATSHTHIQSFTVGYVSRFMLTSQTLTNNQGVITKTGTTSGFNDNICVSQGSCNDTINASFSFQILNMGDFDFGYRDIPESLLLEDLSAVSDFNHNATEYYQLEIRSGQITYKSTSDSPASIGGIQNGDVITMTLLDNDVIIKKNGNVIATKTRDSSTTVFLHTVARLYHPNSSFKILENVLF